MKYKRNTMPAVLTVRLSKEEQGILAKRSKRAGMKKATFVRKLIREEEIVTGADLLSWAGRHAGDGRLRISLRK
jgi:predicted DNA-binding protein